MDIWNEKDLDDDDRPITRSRCSLALFTENFEYAIYGTKPSENEPKGSLGVCARLRKYRAGEKDAGILGLAEGNYERITWIETVKKIMANEIVKLSPYTYDSPLSYNIINKTSQENYARDKKTLKLLNRFKKAFPHLFKWIQSTITPKNFDDYIKVMSVWKKNDQELNETQKVANLTIYSENYIYFINAYRPFETDPYGSLSAQVQLRRQPAGQDHIGQNDLIDGDYKYETWIDIIENIVSYEIVKLGPRAYHPSLTDKY